MFDNRNLYASQLNVKRQIFEETVNLIFEKVTNQQALDKTSNSILEALLVGVATNREYLRTLESPVVRRYYEQMLSHEAFSEENLKAGLSGTVKVNNRLDAAKQIFSGQNAQQW